MNFQDCIQFAKECRTVYIATAEGNQPHVRPMAMQFADERGFYFQTEPVKKFYQQMKSNKKVELCFHKTETTGMGKVMRVTGEMEFVDDVELKNKLFNERPFYRAIGIKSGSDPLFVLYRICRGEAFFWTMANNMHESDIERVKFDCK